MENFDPEIAELEFKYSAEDISLNDFISFAEKLNPIKEAEISSWDYYYSHNSGLPFEFIRYRDGDPPELTLKIKTNEKNNTHRIEIDLPLAKTVSLKLVEKFVNFLGFKENFRIYKFCKIYWFEKVDIVYYIVYDKEMKEIGRRVEIEARKDYSFKSTEEALLEIKAMEQKMVFIGITPQKRMKKSNWEQFKK